MNYKGNTLSGNITKTIVSLKDSWRVFLLTSILICGLIIGAYVIKNNSSLFYNQIEEIITSSIQSKGNNTFIKNFFDGLAINVIFLLFAFSSGLCAVGLPLICFLPFLKGFAVGISGAYIYSQFLLKGVCYCLFVYFPAQIVSSAVLIIACNESFYMSTDILLSVNQKKTLNDKNPVRMYLTRFIILLIMMIASSLTDALLTKLLSSFFRLV